MFRHCALCRPPPSTRRDPAGHRGRQSCGVSHSRTPSLPPSGWLTGGELPFRLPPSHPRTQVRVAGATTPVHVSRPPVRRRPPQPLYVGSRIVTVIQSATSRLPTHSFSPRATQLLHRPLMYPHVPSPRQEIPSVAYSSDRFITLPYAVSGVVHQYTHSHSQSTSPLT